MSKACEEGIKAAKKTSKSKRQEANANISKKLENRRQIEELIEKKRLQEEFADF